MSGVTILVVETSEGVPLRIDVAGAGSRLAAGMIDGLLIGVVFLIVTIVVMLAGALDESGTSRFLLGLLVGGAVLLVALYHVGFHLLWNGQTPGKRLLGIRVASADGRPATGVQHVLRGLVQPVDVLLQLPIALGLILIAVSSRHQRLGDFVAGTLVVRDHVPPHAWDPFPNERWGSAVRTLPLTPVLVARLTPDERALLQAVVTREGLSNDARRSLFVQTARYLAARLELGEFADARVVLKELYLFVRESRDGRVPESFADRFAARAPAGPDSVPPPPPRDAPARASVSLDAPPGTSVPLDAPARASVSLDAPSGTSAPLAVDAAGEKPLDPA